MTVNCKIVTRAREKSVYENKIRSKGHKGAKKTE